MSQRVAVTAAAACCCSCCAAQKEKGEGKRRELQSHLTRLQQMMAEEKTRRKAKELEQGWKVCVCARVPVCVVGPEFEWPGCSVVA